MEPLFAAVEPFGPEDGERWLKYVAWARLPQLRRLVSLDQILCPSLLSEFVDADRDFVVNHNGIDRRQFRSLDYVRARVPLNAPHRLLCTFINPPWAPMTPIQAQFDFVGYDLVETEGAISSLSNCGGFPHVFSNDELSSDGLLTSLERARQVQRDLPLKHPDESHAYCDVWAIFVARS